MQTSPPAKSFFSPAAAPNPPSRHPFDRNVALRRLGCMVDLTHGSLGDYSTVHNLYTSSIKNGNRAQTIKWMKQVSYLPQNFASSSRYWDSTSPSTLLSYTLIRWMLCSRTGRCTIWDFCRSKRLRYSNIWQVSFHSCRGGRKGASRHTPYIILSRSICSLRIENSWWE